MLNMETNRHARQIVWTITLGAAIAMTVLLVSLNTHEWSATLASEGDESLWPVSLEYSLLTPTSPTLPVELAEVTYRFDADGWHFWINKGPGGDCAIRRGTELLISGHGCDGPYFQPEDYSLEEGQGYGVNAALRMNGGIGSDRLERADSTDASRAVASRLGLSSDSLVEIVDSSESHCRSIGLECDLRALNRISVIVHEPSGIPLELTETFGGDVVFAYRVHNVRAGAEATPVESL
jgi:hypothetical protein